MEDLIPVLTEFKMDATGHVPKAMREQCRTMKCRDQGRGSGVDRPAFVFILSKP